MIGEFILKNTVISEVTTAVMVGTAASSGYQFYITFFPCHISMRSGCPPRRTTPRFLVNPNKADY